MKKGAILMSKWERVARYLEHEYGILVDWDERFFECPECGEPIYDCDWEDDELDICPVCECAW